MLKKITKHLVTREIKRENNDSRTILKQPDRMKFDIKRITKDG